MHPCCLFFILFQEADIGAAPIYITEHRAKVVDFSLPFLTVQATVLLRKPPIGQPLWIKTVTDLLDQSEIKYGTLNTGLLLWSLRNTNDSALKLIYRKMTRFYPSVFTESNEEGIQRVRDEKFAFILPSTIGEYISQKPPCDLITVDKFLLNQGFGLVVEKNSPLLTILNNALHKLRDNGFIDRIFQKWWTKKSDCVGIKSSSMFSANKSSNQKSFSMSRVFCIVIIIVCVYK